MIPDSAYTVIGITAVLGVLMLAVPLAVVKLVLSPRNPGREKGRTYECGTVGIGDPWGQFRIQFYTYALVFLVFDVEALFLYPWAVTFRDVGMTGLVEVGIFIGILLLAWWYALRNRALEWEQADD